MAFVRGKRPSGGTVFIDALEEYRIGETGIDRLQDLIDALDQSDYSGWRIACRSISLGPADALRVAAALGGFATLQLELLERFEQYALLEAIKVDDPSGFVERVIALGADTLLGNPTTLILLLKTIDRAPETPTTRAALFSEATRQMSHELNEQMPERRDRPAPAEIEAAAEAACLVLMLSARTDLYLYSGIPPHEAVVTRDDLRPGRVDTEALKAAVDTPMFKSDGVTFQPSHRIVAEYLAGRALARAVVPPDAKVPALPLYRALGFCNGDNDQPAPALTGVFAWFVTALAQSRRPELGAGLITLDPESVLFHGDAAALPTEQRVQLLDIVGRGDPWFLGALRGSSAIGGLAGDDLAAWKDTITHHLAAQAKAIREARFQPPPPSAVAAALAAGPPASAADLRAVIRHTIEELALDIRRSNTASWRQFWNRPYGEAATPRIENDCRDLIVDRLRDRLERYGIPVHNAATEARSINDKRADLIVLGDGVASVPVEAKRHWNREIWTAIEDQLIPYGLSVGSSGHGIYLIFWFGITEGRVPGLGDGSAPPTTTEALKAALEARRPPAHVGKIDIVVIDLSEPGLTS